MNAQMNSTAILPPSNNPNPNRRISAAEVRRLCGNISDMSLWRWLHDDALGFPRPIYIGRRRYWREVEVVAWLDAQVEAAQ